MRVLLAGSVLGALLFGLGCQKASNNGLSLDSSFRQLVVPDVRALGGIRLDKLKQAPLYARHQKEIDFGQLDAASERFGIDPRRDLSELLIAWDGKKSVVMAKGPFDADRLRQKLVSTFGARESRYKRYAVLDDKSESLAFVKTGVAIAGPLDAIHTVLDAKDNGSGGLPDEFSQQLRTVPDTDQVWIVSRGGLPFAEMPMNSDWASALSNVAGYVTNTTAGIGVDTGMRFQADIRCISAEGAQRVRDALKGGIGMARLTTKDNELDLLKLYDSIHVTQEQQGVQVRADISGDLIDKLITKLSRGGSVQK